MKKGNILACGVNIDKLSTLYLTLPPANWYVNYKQIIAVAAQLVHYQY